INRDLIHLFAVNRHSFIISERFENDECYLTLKYRETKKLLKRKRTKKLLFRENLQSHATTICTRSEMIEILIFLQNLFFLRDFILSRFLSRLITINEES